MKMNDFFNFVGLHYGNTIDNVFDLFGLPDEKEATFVSFSRKKIEVEFYYPYDEKMQCKRIKVKWFYPREN